MKIEMKSLSSLDRGINSLLVNVFKKYTKAKSLVDKKANAVFYGFSEIVNESARKPNKLWIDQGKEFYYAKMVS